MPAVLVVVLAVLLALLARLAALAALALAAVLALAVGLPLTFLLDGGAAQAVGVVALLAFVGFGSVALGSRAAAAAAADEDLGDS